MSSHKKYDKLLMVIVMKKKFKEYRMFLLCLVMFVVFVGAGILNILNKNMPRFIAMAIFAFIDLTLILGRYNIILFDDSMILYEWKLAAMLPIVVDYQDIVSVEKKSKHHVIVEHKKKTHVYVFDSEKFVDAFHDIQEEYLKNKQNEDE